MTMMMLLSLFVLPCVADLYVYIVASNMFELMLQHLWPQVIIEPWLQTVCLKALAGNLVAAVCSGHCC